MIGEIEKWSEVIDPKEVEYITGILRDIESNVIRINEHGKRADSIIRGMLLHSRGKSGERQPTDLNAMLAEYVNLGYHGMRATDSSFNIKIESGYDQNMPQLNVIPQDLSRVFLNMINNAFYSTAQKKREQMDTYFPVFKVSTKNLGDMAEIRIRDNGKGFDPSKQTGAGMGLRLMQYRAHSINATFQLTSHPGAGTVVQCSVPVASSATNQPQSPKPE